MTASIRVEAGIMSQVDTARNFNTANQFLTVS